MTLFDEAGALHVPAQAREVFDVTGAGDTVIATLAAMLAAGLPMRDAVPIANRAELQQVIGVWPSEDALREKAQALRRELGLQALLLTRSEEGMTLFDEQGEQHVSAQAREVFDVTGAGDTVIATLAALVGAGLSLREAMPLANRAGGIVVGKFGTATVTYEELFAPS